MCVSDARLLTSSGVSIIVLPFPISASHLGIQGPAPKINANSSTYAAKKAIWWAGQDSAESLQVAFDAGAKRLLLPMASVKDIPTIPGELFAKFQTGFYADASDAVFKVLGVG